MTEPAASRAAGRGPWSRWRLPAVTALLVILLAGGWTAGWLRVTYRFLAGEETFVTLTVDGLFCGTQPDLKSQDLVIRVGSRLTIHNHTGYWTVPVLIARGDAADSPLLAESPPIPQSGEWSYIFWRPGRYYMKVPANTPALQGLSGWISVVR